MGRRLGLSGVGKTAPASFCVCAGAAAAARWRIWKHVEGTSMGRWAPRWLVLVCEVCREVGKAMESQWGGVGAKEGGKRGVLTISSHRMVVM